MPLLSRPKIVKLTCINPACGRTFRSSAHLGLDWRLCPLCHSPTALAGRPPKSRKPKPPETPDP